VIYMLDISANPLGRPFHFPGDPRHGILMLHGFTATPGTLLPMGQALAAGGRHLVRGILLPGHGTNAREMTQTTWRDWLHAACAAFDEMAHICEKVSVVGLSMGATLALLLAESRPVFRVVSIAAALKPLDRKSLFAPLIWRFLPYLEGENAIPPPGFLKEYDVSYECTPVRNVCDLNRLMRMAKTGLHKITCPLLAVQAGRDEAVHPISTRWILERVKGKRALLYLPNSPHVCTLGIERETLFRRAAAFLDQGEDLKAF
jgi:carboxylesterase